MHRANGDVVCPNRLAINCECRSPLLTIQCSHRNLSEFPDLADSNLKVNPTLSLFRSFFCFVF